MAKVEFFYSLLFFLFSEDDNTITAMPMSSLPAFERVAQA
jgi:hypothetical protein